jgi:hypothetical protein
MSNARDFDEALERIVCAVKMWQMHNYSDNQKSLIGLFWNMAVAVDSNLQANLIFQSYCLS